MLYEVITNEPMPIAGQGQLHPLILFPPRYIARITSYNVCYTKLLRFAVQSYAAYVLSLVNRAPLGTIRTLYDASFEKVRTGLPLVYMGIALKNMGDTRRSADAFRLATGKRAAEYNWWGDYGTIETKGYRKLIVEQDGKP